MSGRRPVRRAELLDRLELSAATLRRPVRDYSRGMRQKVGVIQALQHDPDVAILDEPTEGLDPLMQYAFYGILDDLRRAGRTIFFSSHVLSEVERVCDRVAIVRRGRLVALEDIPTLLARRKRNVEMRLDGTAPDLGRVAGVSDVETGDGWLRCRLEGDVGPFLAAIAGHRIHDLTIEPARLEEAFLEFYADDAGGSPVAAAERMNRAVFAHVWHSNIRRVAVVTAALVIWGTFLPIIYNAYGSVIKNIFASGSIPPQFQQFAEFGGGDLFSLSGSVALGFIHPIAVALVLVVAVGFTSLAIAGERQRGTLEILLSRPISRRGLVVTLAVAGALFVGIAVAGLVAGALLGSTLTGQTAALGVGQLPLLWLNGALLFWAIGAVALLASASFDRLGQALGITLTFVFVSYFLDVLGSLWPDAKGLQLYSVFSYLDPKAILSGFPDASDFAVLAVIALAALVAALIIFPRRDLAAPS